MGNVHARIDAIEDCVAKLAEGQQVLLDLLKAQAVSTPETSVKPKSRKARKDSPSKMDWWPTSKRDDVVVELPADTQARMLAYLRAENAVSKETAKTTGQFVHNALKGIVPKSQVGLARKAVRLAVENGEFAVRHHPARKCRVWLDRTATRKRA